MSNYSFLRIKPKILTNLFTIFIRNMQQAYKQCLHWHFSPIKIFHIILGVTSYIWKPLFIFTLINESSHYLFNLFYVQYSSSKLNAATFLLKFRKTLWLIQVIIEYFFSILLRFQINLLKLVDTLLEI